MGCPSVHRCMVCGCGPKRPLVSKSPLPHGMDGSQIFRRVRISANSRSRRSVLSQHPPYTSMNSEPHDLFSMVFGYLKGVVGGCWSVDTYGFTDTQGPEPSPEQPSTPEVPKSLETQAYEPLSVLLVNPSGQGSYSLRICIIIYIYTHYTHVYIHRYIYICRGIERERERRA